MPLEVLLEQKSPKTRKELKNDGWSSVKPSDFSSEKYDTLQSSDGFLMYKSKEGSMPPPPPEEPNQEPVTPPTPAPAANPYEKWGRVFKFTTEDDKEVRIAFNNELISAIEKFKNCMKLQFEC